MLHKLSGQPDMFVLVDDINITIMLDLIIHLTYGNSEIINVNFSRFVFKLRRIKRNIEIFVFE